MKKLVDWSNYDDKILIMKRFIVFLFVSLVIVGSLFADSDKFWKRGYEGEKAIYHHTIDYAYTDGTQLYFYEDCSEKPISIIISYEKGYEFIGLFFDNISAIKATPIGCMVGSDILNDENDRLDVGLDAISDNTQAIITDDYNMLLNEMLNRNYVQFFVVFSDKTALILNVNCENVYKYFL